MPAAKTSAIVVHPRTPVVEPQEYFVAPEKLLSGNPRQTVWLEYQDPSTQFCVGIWSSEVGEWRILYTEEEYCQILEGRSVITDSSGNSVVVVQGSEFTIPAGFAGTWRVEAPTRKRFVIFERR